MYRFSNKPNKYRCYNYYDYISIHDSIKIWVQANILNISGITLFYCQAVRPFENTLINQ